MWLLLSYYCFAPKILHTAVLPIVPYIRVYLSIPKETETLGTSGSRAEVLCALGGVPHQLEFLSALSLFPIQNAMFPRTWASVKIISCANLYLGRINICLLSPQKKGLHPRGTWELVSKIGVNYRSIGMGAEKKTQFLLVTVNCRESLGTLWAFLSQQLSTTSKDLKEGWDLVSSSPTR